MTADIILGLFIGAMLVLALYLASLKLTDEPLGDGSDGDCGVLPRDFKVLHGASLVSERQQDHDA
jgi:hypothetical protein